VSRLQTAATPPKEEDMGRTPHELLEQARRIAVVGMSADRSKAAHRVPAELIAAGFEVIPVNPNHAEILGMRCVASLGEIDGPIDLVDVFRPPRDCPAVAAEAVAAGAGAIWLQLGIRSAEARDIAAVAGIDYVEDLCIAVERRRFGITKA